MQAKPAKKNSIGRQLDDNPVLRLFVIAAVIFVAFSILLPGKFLSIANMQSMAVQFPEFGILAIAIMLTMITGGIDLSVVGAANLAGILAALTPHAAGRRGWRRNVTLARDSFGNGCCPDRGIPDRHLQRPVGF
ncbi:MAG: ABC transporter permease [Anaerolineales bacterium]|nr:ABC transporter permease [Anaerolineales bacterium]